MAKTTAIEYYETLKEMFKGCSFIICLERRWPLSEMKLKEGRDAHAHLDKMMVMKEELALMDKPISDKDFFNMVYVSLPKSYNSVLYSISISMSLHSYEPWLLILREPEPDLDKN
ncbi:hypothetical protein BS17DRAFT_764812 [Gyrodon lividus]|nr:hypothetical protein BS17DRAFT_764812 [Gyrodon lividus]